MNVDLNSTIQLGLARRMPLMFSAALLFAGVAAAEEKVRYSASAAMSSALFDRGEQIGAETLEVSFGAETSAGGANVYASFYRLLPVGPDQAAFDDEADYTLGVSMEGEAVSADLSANWLTYPGEAAEPSLEFVGAFDFDAPLSPGVITFYDADAEDWGVEALVQARHEIRAWTAYALGRAGFVEPGDGSAARSYAGVEIGASRPVTANAEIGVYARAEAADENTYVGEIEDLTIRMRDRGFAVGLSLSLAG